LNWGAITLGPSSAGKKCLRKGSPALKTGPDFEGKMSGNRQKTATGHALVERENERGGWGKAGPGNGLSCMDYS